jgi:hypothetical protein
MKTLGMPGFTAESSLSHTDEHYRLLRTPDPYTGLGKIAPQRCFYTCVDGFCGWLCERPPM